MGVKTPDVEIGSLNELGKQEAFVLGENAYCPSCERDRPPDAIRGVNSERAYCYCDVDYDTEMVKLEDKSFVTGRKLVANEYIPQFRRMYPEWE